MSSKIFDLPRHKRPLWEVFAFTATLAGLIGLALVRNSVDKVLSSKPAQCRGQYGGNHCGFLHAGIANLPSTTRSP